MQVEQNQRAGRYERDIPAYLDDARPAPEPTPCSYARFELYLQRLRTMQDKHRYRALMRDLIDHVWSQSGEQA